MELMLILVNLESILMLKVMLLTILVGMAKKKTTLRRVKRDFLSFLSCIILFVFTVDFKGRFVHGTSSRRIHAATWFHERRGDLVYAWNRGRPSHIHLKERYCSINCRDYQNRHERSIHTPRVHSSRYLIKQQRERLIFN